MPEPGAGGVAPPGQKFCLEIGCKAVHCRHAARALGIAVVVGVGVDVIDEGPSSASQMNSKAATSRPACRITAHAQQPAASFRVLEPGDDFEFLRTGIILVAVGHAQIVESADIGRAQLEPLGRYRPYRIQEPAADELDTGDEGRRRLDVGLQERDSIDGRFECRATDIGLERRRIPGTASRQAPCRHDYAW